MRVVQLPALGEPAELPCASPLRAYENNAQIRKFTRSHTLGAQTNNASVSAPTEKLAYTSSPPSGPLPPYASLSNNVEQDMGKLFKAVSEARRITVVCGAGISVSSPANIPDFRSATGLFQKLKGRYPDAGLSSGKDLFDARLFGSESATSLFYTMMAELKDMADAAQPTVFHHLLKRLDSEGRLQRVYTQNIDGLEEKVGLTFGLGDASSPCDTSVRDKRRKIFSPNKGRTFGRAQSDSVLLARSGPSEKENKPLFPRAIPLHGSLSTLSCLLCSNTLVLDKEYDDRAGDALSRMRSGEPVWCDECQASENLRAAAGLRPRGVGRMKVDVVLYNGMNESAEQVGACVERDILGLRDPNEPSVPGSVAEARARLCKEYMQDESKEEDVGDLSMNADEMNAENVLGGAFNEDEEDGAKNVFLDARPEPVPTPQPIKPRRTRLKPLPPDLLIVAGTSLKVPGTKRIVREFAKACRARDDAIPEEKSSPRPIRTVYLNYDYPQAAREWDGVFDVWIQGDVQQSALGLCSPLGTTTCSPAEAFIQRHSWHEHMQRNERIFTHPPKPSARPPPAAKTTSKHRLGMRSSKLSTKPL
ncbi:hypothetical protein MVES1_001897 [Malassezia vespertilionis]|uniref:uncharacterized protein n=1 Tax=Malassezia vespertilionis TaxID=2020962 RepID=UPI0024B12960|nr:uncharacterized protein MVES1_001897 [Malassezia vespertilionis]WFD06546.1 hypothetical protein MVES1_001897 [Malassezia vespertilionis]